MYISAQRGASQGHGRKAAAGFHQHRGLMKPAGVIIDEASDEIAV